MGKSANLKRSEKAKMTRISLNKKNRSIVKIEEEIKFLKEKENWRDKVNKNQLYLECRERSIVC